MADERGLMPWVVVSPAGVYWLGHAHNENGAWTDALGWPDAEEVAEHKRAGWYAAEATVTWQHPAGVGVPQAPSKPECWLIEADDGYKGVTFVDPATGEGAYDGFIVTPLVRAHDSVKGSP